MSDRLLQGGEVLTAIEASAVRAREAGYDKAIVELGLDPEQLRQACRHSALQWVDRIPLRPTIGELVNVIGSAEVEGVTAGVRLGRMYGSPQGAISGAAQDALLAVVHELRAAARALTDAGFGEVAHALSVCAGRVQIVVDTERAEG